jgi:hypothetical protein
MESSRVVSPHWNRIGNLLSTREGTDREMTYIVTQIMLTSGVAEENKSMGTPRVGGPYSLIDHNGNKVSQDTYAGKHTLVRTSYG